VWLLTFVFYGLAFAATSSIALPSLRRLLSRLPEPFLGALVSVVLFGPVLAAAAIGVALHYRLHRRVGSSPGPLTVYALIVLTLAVVLATTLAIVYLIE